MGGSSSQVVGYRYYAKFTAFIGNRIEKLIGVNFDNRGWIIKENDDDSSSLTIDKPSLYGENEGGVAGIVDIHPGLPDAEPNAEYQTYFPLVSGYPYQSYLVFRGLGGVKTGGGLIGGVIGSLQAHRHDSFYLGNSGYMKEMLLWVKRTRVRNDGRRQWYEVREDGAIVCEIGAVTTEFVADWLDGAPFDWSYIEYTSNYVAAPVGIRRNLSYLGGDSIYTLATQLQSAYAGGIPEDSWAESKMAFNLEMSSGFVQVDFLVRATSSDYNFDVKGEVLGITTNTSTVYEGVIKNTYISGSFVVDVSKTFYVSIKAIGAEYELDGYSGIVSSSIHQLVISKTFDRYDKVDLTYLDINPIHKIREILTDDTAMAKPEVDVNDQNFMKAADRIWDEGLGISWAIDEKSCIDAIEELCYHVEAGIRVNRQTGLYEMVLFRDDWFAEDEIHTIAENKIKDLSLEVMNSDNIVNQLNVTYYDRQRIKNSTFSVYENGSILTMGHANAESVEFPYFMNMRNAEIVANWKLKQFSTPAWSGSFTTGWKEARKWNRYDLIRLPWSSKWEGTILARIMKINLGNGTDNTVTIDFEEVIPYSGEMNTSIVVDAPVESAPQPPQPSMNAVFEAPYYLTVLRAGQTNADLELSNNPDIGYVAAIATKPQNNSLNALLYTDGGVGEFEQVSRLDYCDILQLDQPIVETTSSFTVTGSLTQTTNSNNLILLNGELMGFVSFDDVTKFLTVKRGVLDTIPKKHSNGTLFVFDLPDVAFDSTQYAQSEIVEAQVLTTTPSGIQELAVTGMPVEIQARAIRPYPPANVKINGEYWPEEIETDLVLTWVDRNRLQQTGGVPLSWYEPSVTLEPNVEYVLELYDADDVLISSENVGAVDNTIVDYSAVTTAACKIRLYSVRDDIESLEAFEHTVIASHSAPSDLQGTWNETTQAVDLTWEFD